MSCWMIGKQSDLFRDEDQLQRQPWSYIADVSPQQLFDNCSYMSQQIKRHETSPASMFMQCYLMHLSGSDGPAINKEDDKQSDLLDNIEPTDKNRGQRDNFKTIKNKSEKKNYPIFITRDIKSLVNSALQLKKRGKLPAQSTLSERFLSFFSKGLKKSESIRTLKAFLTFSQPNNDHQKENRIVKEFSSFVQPRSQISEQQFISLSKDMREWLMRNRYELTKLASNRKDDNYVDYVICFLSDLENGEVKVYRK